MSLNINKKGQEIAIIKNSDAYKGITISVSDVEGKDTKISKNFNELHIDDGIFQFVPDKKKDRFTAFVCGSAGSGKNSSPHYRAPIRQAPFRGRRQGRSAR